MPTHTDARTNRRTVCFATGATLIAALLAGCSAPPGTSAEGSEDKSGVELKVGQFSWTAAEIETSILAEIAEAHPELGVSSVKSVSTDPAPGWVGLGRGDVDALVEVNLPNQQELADKNAQSTELVSQTYGDAAQSWFVPRYLVEKGGAAEGLTSVDQLSDPAWAKKVGGTLYDADPGWITTKQNDARIKGLGADLEHSKSSEAALIAQAQRSYQREEPFLLYFYHPHWLFEQLDLVQLKESRPYKDDCFTESGPNDCAIPSQEAWIAINKDLGKKAPEFAAALKDFSIPLDDVEALLGEHEEKGTSSEDLATEWVREHSDEIEKWIQ